jgi:hypothetical protein
MVISVMLVSRYRVVFTDLQKWQLFVMLPNCVIQKWSSEKRKARLQTSRISSILLQVYNLHLLVGPRQFTFVPRTEIRFRGNHKCSGVWGLVADLVACTMYDHFRDFRVRFNEFRIKPNLISDTKKEEAIQMIFVTTHGVPSKLPSDRPLPTRSNSAAIRVILAYDRH